MIRCHKLEWACVCSVHDDMMLLMGHLTPGETQASQISTSLVKARSWPTSMNPRADSLTPWSLLSSCEKKRHQSLLSLSRRLSSREPPPEKWSWLRFLRDLDQLHFTDVPLLLCYLQVHLTSILALRLGSSVKKVESFLGNFTDPLLPCVLHVFSDMIQALTRAPLSRSTSSVNRGMN